VLAWFPKAYTRGWTLECKSLDEHGDLIKRYDVTYFVISVDPLDKNKGFAERRHADFPLLSDPTKKTADAAKALGHIGDRFIAPPALVTRIARSECSIHAPATRPERWPPPSSSAAVRR
jgi:peroxiredoxin